MKSKTNTNCDALVQGLLNPADISHLAQIKHGSVTEPIAAKKLISLLESKGHKNVAFEPAGFLIHPSKKYIGASPDGYITCDCCEKSS